MLSQFTEGTMALRTVSKEGGNFKYVKYTECEPGQVLAQGNYLGTREGKFGIQHLFREESGMVVVLNKAGQLDKNLEENVQLGDFVQVTFKGKSKITKGDWKGAQANNFIVQVDDERGVDPSNLEMPEAAPRAEASDEAEEEGPSAEEQEATRKATAAKVAAAKTTVAPAAAATKAKSVKDLVSNYRK